MDTRLCSRSIPETQIQTIKYSYLQQEQKRQKRRDTIDYIPEQDDDLDFNPYDPDTYFREEVTQNQSSLDYIRKVLRSKSVS
jgi:hypothetical protein